jgi:hypothetical protein
LLEPKLPLEFRVPGGVVDYSDVTFSSTGAGPTESVALSEANFLQASCGKLQIWGGGWGGVPLPVRNAEVRSGSLINFIVHETLKITGKQAQGFSRLN